MFAVGHLALGYLSGKATSNILNVKTDLPLLFVASIIPDIDLLIPGHLHRGFAHSAVVSSLIFLSAYLLWGKRVTPYFAALATHSVIGDYLTNGGVQLLWPIDYSWYGGFVELASLTNVLLEVGLFLTCLAVMVGTRDLWVLFKEHDSNLLLSIPFCAILSSSVFGFPLPVPAGILPPHWAFLLLFAVSIGIDLKPRIRKSQKE
jgi:membrane-bound metal-dependent hydrolase YbcI (DUF457 family)